jgi:hypothetical protein
MSPSSSPAMRLTGAAGRCARRAAIRPSSVSRFRPRAPGSSLGVELVQGAPPSVLQPGARGDQILAVIDEKLDRAGDVGVLYMPQKRRAPIIGRGARRRIGRRTGRSATSCRCERSVNRRQHVGAGNRHAQLARASTRRPEPQPGVEVRPCHRSGRSPHDGTGDAVTRSWSSRRPSTPCVPSWAASPCAGPWSSVKGRGRIADAVQRRTGRRRDRSRGRRHHVDCKEPVERPSDRRCCRAALHVGPRALRLHGEAGSCQRSAELVDFTAPVVTNLQRIADYRGVAVEDLTVPAGCATRPIGHHSLAVHATTLGSRSDDRDPPSDEHVQPGRPPLGRAGARLVESGLVHVRNSGPCRRRAAMAVEPWGRRMFLEASGT